MAGIFEINFKLHVYYMLNEYIQIKHALGVVLFTNKKKIVM